MDNVLISDILKEVLNEVGKESNPKYEFSVTPDFVKFVRGKGEFFIQMELETTTSSNINPIPGYTNIIRDFVLFAPLSADRENYHMENLNKIFFEFIKRLNGTAVALGNGKAIFNFKTPIYDDFQIRAQVGGSVLCDIVFSVNYSEDAVTTSDKVWLLDSVPIQYLEEEMTLEKDGTTNNVHGEFSTKSLPIKQTRLFKFTLPNNKSVVSKTLQKDMLSGDMTKTYELTYYDGITYTAEEPFITTVSLYRTNRSKGRTPAVTDFEVYFAEVDKLNTTGIQYYMALTDNPFDENNINKRYFTKTLTQEVESETNVLLELSDGNGVMNIFYYKNYTLNEETGVFSVFNRVNEFSQFEVGSRYYFLYNGILTTMRVNEIIGGSYLRMRIDYYDQTATLYNTPQDAQRAYYEDKVNEGAPYEQIKAPNLNSLTLTQQVYINTSSKTLLELLTKNYAIIKVFDYDKNEVVDYFYYYIQSASVGANNQILVDLKMDSIQTYYFKPNIEFSDCLINRAHLNRWIDNGDGTVKFDNSLESELFETEDFGNFPKRITKRTQLKMQTTVLQDVNDWLFENVDYYIYTFLDKSHTYNVFNVNNDNMPAKLPVKDPLKTDGEYYNPTQLSIKFTNLLGTGYISDTGCVCYPAYKKHNKIRMKKNGRYINIESIGFEEFRKNNNDSSFFYNIKFSLMPPFPTSPTRDKIYIEDGNLIIENLNGDKNNNSIAIVYDSLRGISTTKYNNGEAYGLFTGIVQYPLPKKTDKYPISDIFYINKSEIVGSKKNIRFNPKLYNSNFKNLRISTNNGDYFDYDIQKIGENYINFLYTEPIQPEITKGYLRLDAPVGLYSEETTKNYLGLITSIDNSIAFTNDQYANFIANNKNFWLQSNINMLSKAVQGGVSAASTIASGNINNSKTAGVGAVAGLVQGAVSLVTSVIDRNLTVDNLQQAPDILKSASGNVIFNIQVNSLGLYVDEYSVLNNELEMANDYMFVNGFTCNKAANLKKYDNLRFYFNFIQANIDNICGVSISNEARNDLKQLFANGIRFWNEDNIQFKYENYEKSLTI